MIGGDGREGRWGEGGRRERKVGRAGGIIRKFETTNKIKKNAMKGNYYKVEETKKWHTNYSKCSCWNVRTYPREIRDRHTDGQIHGQTDRHTHGQTDRHKHGQTDGQRDRHMDRQTLGPADRRERRIGIRSGTFLRFLR